MIKVTSESISGLNPEALRELERIAELDGELKPERIVEVARSPNNPLHERFEWDDAVAGHEHRLSQARSLIRHVKVTFLTREEKTIQVRHYVFQDGAYRQTRVVMAHRESRDAILQTALDELESIARKYAALEELSGLRSTILDLIRRYRKRHAAGG